MTATVDQQQAPLQRTEHPHVVKSEGVLGGFPRIDDTRISVLQIFRLYEAGTPVGEIVEHYPPLTPAQVHDAISYAYDHSDEMTEHASRQTLRSVLRRADMVYVGGRLIPRVALKNADLPPGVEAFTWETLPDELDRP